MLLAPLFFSLLTFDIVRTAVEKKTGDRRKEDTVDMKKRSTMIAELRTSSVYSPKKLSSI